MKKDALGAKRQVNKPRTNAGNPVAIAFGFAGSQVLSLAVLFLLAFTMSAWADVDRIFVRPGTTVVIANGKDKIEAAGNLPPGAYLTSQTVDNAPYWALLYNVPSDLASETALSFTRGGTTRTVLVEVAAQPASDDPTTIGKASRLLFAMLVLAIILEAAFSVIFNWRVFLEFFDGRGVRTVVMFVAACLIVSGFHADFVASLLQVYGINATSTLETTVLTALVLAGGSASVNTLMVALNLRENRKVEDVRPKPPPTKAWVAIKIGRAATTISIELLQEVKPLADEATSQRLVGIVTGDNIWMRLGKYFWRDVSRLPRSGGMEVDPDKSYTFILRGRTSTGDKFCDLSGRSLTKIGDTFDPAPQSYAFAAGSVVDFEVTL
jgi:hypothetical protein